MRLYYRAGTGRAVRVAWALEELGLDYEAVAVSGSGSGSDADFRALAPLGRVPVIEWDDGAAVYDSTAILCALADRHPASGLLAAAGTRERELALQYSLVAMTELEKAATNARRGWDLLQQRDLFAAGLAPFADALDGHEFLVADRFGVADIVFAGVLLVGGRVEFVGGGPQNVAPPGVLEYLDALGARPTLARAHERTEWILSERL